MLAIFVLKEPMALCRMEKKLNERVYKKRQEFVDDFDLIVTNCVEFNGKDSGKW